MRSSPYQPARAILPRRLNNAPVILAAVRGTSAEKLRFSAVAPTALQLVPSATVKWNCPMASVLAIPGRATTLY